MIEHQHGDVRYLQFSLYQPFPEMTHGIFTRAGGYSPPPYQGLNTSTPPRGLNGDTIDNVVRNRQETLQALDINNNPCITLWQVHGADVVRYEQTDEWRTDWGRHSYYQQSWTPASIRKGDALITKEHPTSIALSFADCVPILFYDPEKQVIGMAHGGWRGTARGVVMATLAAMNEQFGCQLQNIYAGIGPAIGPCCYEVSEEVSELFQGKKSFAEMPTHEQYIGKVHESAVFVTKQLPDRESLRLDLQETNRNQLQLAGLRPEQIEIMHICTGCNADLFFSHRCENGKTGRFAAVIALV